MRGLQQFEGVIMPLRGIVVMVEDEVHGVVKVLESHWIQVLNLVIGKLLILDQLIQLLSCHVLDLQIETFSSLTLLQVLIDPA